MSRKTIFLPLLLMLLATGCIYPYGIVPEADQNLDYLVVDGSILAGGTSRIMVTRVKTSNRYGLDEIRDEYYAYARSAFEIWLEVEGGDEIEAVYRKPVVDQYITTYSKPYYEITCPDLKAGDKCRLCIAFMRESPDSPRGEAQYRSDWITVLEAPVIDGLSLKANYGTQCMDFFVDAHSDNPGTPYYRIETDEIWEYHSQARAEFVYYPESDSIGHQDPPPLYYCWRYSDDKKGTHIGAEDAAGGRVVNFKYLSVGRYEERLQVAYKSGVSVSSMSKECHDYLENIDKLSSGGADLFTPTPSERRGNVWRVGHPEEMVIGYVSASEFARDSIYYINADHKFYLGSSSGPAIADQLRVFPRSEWKNVDQNEFVLYKPSENPKDEGNPDAWTWIPVRCTDCRYLGGSKDKPAGWPNDHY
ncbi:MAG: DUF4249 domain-containing protein [Bacteroidales bacterium]|nr:DUF4249 domain-containing protein [Bacteroidales bacterium]